MGFSYNIDSRKGVEIIRPAGRLIEKYDAAQMIEEVKDLISMEKKVFIIDLKDLEYINSSGLNVLINILTLSRNAGGDAIVCHVSPKLKKLFLITKLDTVFQIEENQSAAYKYLENTKKNYGS